MPNTENIINPISKSTMRFVINPFTGDLVPYSCNGNTVRNKITYYDQQTMPTNPNSGDTWVERDSSNNINENWFWNGTYWLSQRREIFRSKNYYNFYDTTSYVEELHQGVDLEQTQNIFLENLQYSIQINGTNNSSNCYTIIIQMVGPGVTDAALLQYNTSSLGTNRITQTQSINKYYNVINSGYTQLVFYIGSAGSPGLLSYTSLVVYGRQAK